MKKLKSLYCSFGCIYPAWLLLIRLTIAFVFIQTGYAKSTNIAEVTAFFESLNIPMAYTQAVLVSWLEMIGGIAIALGLFTRVFAFLLGCIMAVAIVTAQLPQMQFFLDLFGFQEWNYILLFGLLILNGAGKWSFDALFCKKCCEDTSCATDLKAGDSSSSNQ